MIDYVDINDKIFVSFYDELFDDWRTQTTFFDKEVRDGYFSMQDVCTNS